MEEEFETPAPKPSAPKPKAPKKTEAKSKDIAIFDAVLDDETIAQHTEEVVAADDTEESEKEAAPLAAAAPSVESSAPASPHYVVSGKDKDEVRLSAIVFENKVAKKSLSVHHLQRRLNEWGFAGGYGDRDGWYGVPTRDAVHAFQESKGLPVGDLDMATLSALFENDSNVRLLP